MSPEAIAATERAISRASTLEQLDALERSLLRAYRFDPKAAALLRQLENRRRELMG
jgi:hypothetical protein